MPKIQAVAEIVLNARDLPALSAFYQTALGFELHSQQRNALEDDPNDAPTIVFLKIADLPAPFGTAHPQLLVLIDSDRHRHAIGNFDPPGGRNSTLNHLAFQIDEADYETEFERLAGLGLKPAKTSFASVKSRAIFFQDPEENLLELICHDPQA